MKRYEEIDRILDNLSEERDEAVIFMLNELTLRRNLAEDKNFKKNGKLAYGNIKENGQVKKLVAIYFPNEEAMGITEDEAENLCLDYKIKSKKAIILPKKCSIVEEFK